MWRPIDSAPKTGPDTRPIILYAPPPIPLYDPLPDGLTLPAYYQVGVWDGGRWTKHPIGHGRPVGFEPTHWIDLPTPPETTP